MSFSSNKWVRLNRKQRIKEHCELGWLFTVSLYYSNTLTEENKNRKFGIKSKSTQ